LSLDYARMHARRGNITGATGQAAAAVMERPTPFCARAVNGCATKNV
jgi:hypothetical protein